MTSQSPSIQASVPALTVGNMVTLGFQIFRLNFNDYFVRSFVSHFWLWLAIVGSLFLAGIVAAFGVGLTATVPWPSSLSLWAGIGLVGSLLVLPPIIFMTGRLLAVGGLMTRMGFNTLRHRLEPEELLRQKILKRPWGYFGLWFLVYLGLTIAYGGLFGLGVLIFVGLRPPWLTIQAQLANTDLEWIWVLSSMALGLLGGVGLLAVGYYLFGRLWMVDAVLAIEDWRSPLDALVRSWEITERKGWSTVTALFLVSLITIPFLIFVTLFNMAVPIVSLLSGVILFPLYQSVKAVQFYDLASAKIGLLFDLHLTHVDPRRYLRRVVMQTPEGVELDFALGGVGSRTLAWVVDQLILYVGLSILFVAGALVYAYTVLPVLVEQLSSKALDDVNLWLLAIAGLLSFFITNGYFITFETLWRGQTPGKRLAKIRVVRDDGQPVGVKEAALRSFVGWIDLALFGIGLSLVLFSKSEKRLGDLAAGTLVVQDEQIAQAVISTVPSHFDTLTHDTAAVLRTQTDPSLLSVNHYFVLQNFLGHRGHLSTADRTRTTARLAEQLRFLLVPHSPQQLGSIPNEALVEAAYLVCQPGGEQYPFA